MNPKRSRTSAALINIFTWYRLSAITSNKHRKKVPVVTHFENRKKREKKKDTFVNDSDRMAPGGVFGNCKYSRNRLILNGSFELLRVICVEHVPRI